MKSGWKTSELWLSVIAMVIGVLIMVWPGGETNVVVGAIVTILGKLGYTVPRGLAKGQAAKALATPPPSPTAVTNVGPVVGTENR